MKLVTTKLVAKRAIAPLFFVHSTLRNFILFSHLLRTLYLPRCALNAFFYPVLPDATRSGYYPDDDAEDSSSFLGDSSHSSSSGGAEPSPVGNDTRLPDGFLMCLCASRRNPNTLRLITNADTARTNIVEGEKLTSPPVPRKEETTIAEIMNVGTVTAPEKADDRAIFRRTIAR